MKIGLSVKLIIAFIGVALITLTVGLVGFFGLEEAHESINVLVEESIPAITDLEIVMVKQQTLKSIMRTLTSPFLTDEDFDRQLKNWDKFREERDVAMKRFEAVHVTPEAKAMYQEFLTSLAPLIAENNAYRAAVTKMRSDGVGPLEYATAASGLALSGTSRKLFDDNIDSLQKLLEYVKKHYGEELPRQSQDMINLMTMVIMITIVAGFVIALMVGWFLARSITKPVVRIVNSLSSGSDQIGNASSQLSVSSQQIASGASEQASGIEETTSSMEELASMVKQNVENAKEASVLAAKTSEAATQGSAHMERMLASMTEIGKAADDIKTVIDVIDDIAFQTNMLALNAAVEAARAGEAGMGFAVVADEVKNLANRSAASAKETAQMIKSTLQKTEEGQLLTKELADIFKEIMVNSSKSNEMTKEVETASRQQDEGITQVNKAVVQLDTVVQQNAAASEETASSAEELQSQVVSLNEIIEGLSVLVLGGKAAAASLERDRANAASAKSAKLSGSGWSVKKNEVHHHLARPSSEEAPSPRGKRIVFEDDPEFREEQEF